MHSRECGCTISKCDWIRKEYSDDDGENYFDSFWRALLCALIAIINFAFFIWRYQYAASCFVRWFSILTWMPSNLSNVNHRIYAFKQFQQFMKINSQFHRLNMDESLNEKFCNKFCGKFA